jgi:hypothetical protein
MPPLTRKNIAFIVLHDNPQWVHIQIGPDEEFTAKIQIFGLEKTLVFKYGEFNTYRATYMLMRLDDPVRWSVWISELMFPSEQALEAPAFFL